MSLKQIIENLSSVLSTELFEIGGAQVTLGTLLVAGLVIALTFGLSSLAQRGVRRGMMRRGVVDEGVVDVTFRVRTEVGVTYGSDMKLDVHFDAPVEGGLGRLAAAS